jgi:acetylornithine deacetylase
MLAAAKSIVESGTELHGSLILAAVCDEEYRSIGTEALMEKVDADAAIVTEPSELDIVIAHKGFAWIDVETRGVAAHGSKPEAGVDAIIKMGKFLMEIDKLQNGRLKQKTHNLLGPPSIHASTIKGGLGLSTYPDYCKLQVERRLIPGETPTDVDAEMNSIITRLSDDDFQFNGIYNITFTRGPMEIRPDERICQVLYSAISDVKGSSPDFVGMSGWLDSEIIWKKGVPVVIFGPRGRGAHAAVEYVELDSVVDTAQILEKVIIRFCNQ